MTATAELSKSVQSLHFIVTSFIYCSLGESYLHGISRMNWHIWFYSAGLDGKTAKSLFGVYQRDAARFTGIRACTTAENAVSRKYIITRSYLGCTRTLFIHEQVLLYPCLLVGYPLYRLEISFNDESH